MSRDEDGKYISHVCGSYILLSTLPMLPPSPLHTANIECYMDKYECINEDNSI